MFETETRHLQINKRPFLFFHGINDWLLRQVFLFWGLHVPFYGMEVPRHGIELPFHGMELCRHGMKLPRQGMEVCRHGMVQSFQGMELPRQGINVSFQGMELSRLGIKVSRQGVKDLFQGMVGSFPFRNCFQQRIYNPKPLKGLCSNLLIFKSPL